MPPKQLSGAKKRKIKERATTLIQSQAGAIKKFFVNIQNEDEGVAETVNLHEQIEEDGNLDELHQHELNEEVENLNQMQETETGTIHTRYGTAPHHPPPHFTPIEEGNEDEEFSPIISSSFSDNNSNTNYKHHPTPLHSSDKTRANNKGTSRKKQHPKNEDVEANTTGVSCNKCRPNNRDKISVVPLGNNNGSNILGYTASPNGIFKSIMSSLAIKKSPRSSSEGGSSAALTRDEHWKIVVAELSNKLVQASRKRDEAVLEASKLKHSMSELEKKLNKLEIYCHSLKSGLEICSTDKNVNGGEGYQVVRVGDRERVIEHFLVLVSEARTSVRALSRALSLQMRQMGPKVFDRVASVLRDYDVKVSCSRNPRGLVVYLEALLNGAFFEEFESVGFQKGGPSPVLNPVDRCEANFVMFGRLRGLTWEEVLSKGTRHFSEDFSKFCDRKMSEIVAMLGWNRAWPEPLLQAFFGASKAVWLVHLLANSVHPGLPIFRVDKGVGFDPVYMEDMGADKVRKLVPAVVRVMVTPGFYVYDNVIKCKVLCRYYNLNNINIYDHLSSEKGFTLSPSYDIRS